MTPEEAQDRCDDLTDLYGLPPYRLMLDGRLGTGGWHLGSQRVIKISKHMNDQEFDETLRHELAHALVYRDCPQARDAHGPEWKEKARLLGAVPEACTAPETEWLQARRARKRRVS